MHDLALSKFRSSDKGSAHPDEDPSAVASLFKVIISGVCYTIVMHCVFLGVLVGSVYPVI